MTNTEDPKLAIARDYAIGLLSGSDYAQATLAAERDPDFAAEIARTEGILAGIALQLPAEDVTGDFFDRLEARIHAIESGSPRCLVARAEEGIWIDWTPGARIKVLHRNPYTRRQTFLLELAPGARADNHAHDDDEECYVISGDIWFGDTELRTGDYHLAQKGARHGPVRSTSGCLCLIIAAAD